MKFFLEVLVLVACALPFMQAYNLKDNVNCVTASNGTISSSSGTQEHTHLQIPDDMIDFRVILQDSPSPMIQIVGSQIKVCDEVAPVVNLTSDDGGYLVIRDPNPIENDGYYELTVFYDWTK